MDNNTIMASAKEVITKDIEALKVLLDEFPYGFVEAVQYISNELKGKIIVTGIGKSGYVAKRLSTTLASTGTKSVFVHAAESSHGDMGIIEDNDCVIAVSGSGETKEMNNILNYTRRFGIKLIVICSNPQSTMGKLADINITIPDLPETCVLGKAPSTSIILLSAMANALIYTMEKIKGLTCDMYQNWHPGGKIGASLLKISKIMHTGSDIPAVNTDANIMEVIDVMSRKIHFGCVAVVDEDSRLCGVFTDGDIRRRLYEGVDLMNKKVSDVMGHSPKSINMDTLASAATLIMNEKQIQVLFVVDNNDKLVGIVGFHDLLKAGVV